MESNSKRPVWIGLPLMIVLVGLVAACGPNEEELAAVARAEELNLIREEKQALDAKKDERRLALEELAAGEVAEEGLPALEEKIAHLNSEIENASAELMSRLVTFINDDPPEVGAELSAEQREVVRMKSAEDLEIAMDYVEQAGDYVKAEGIIQESLKLDTDNELLLEKLDWVREWRFIDRDRFSQVKNGMTQAEVREFLGPVNRNNVRDYPENNAVGWFFRKDPDSEGGAAGVFFNEKGGEMKVFRVDYEAIKPQ